MVLLPVTTAECAAIVVEKKDFTHNRLNYKVTVSIGVGVFLPEQQNTPDEVLKFADKALYQAKDTGRNRFCLYEIN